MTEPTDTELFVVYDNAFNAARDAEDPDFVRDDWTSADVRRFHTAGRRALFELGLLRKLDEQ